METDLQQRLIGAIVLTLIAAIFIPLFLSEEPVTLMQSEESLPVSELEPQTSLVPVTEINEVIEQPVIETNETVTEVSTIDKPLQQTESQPPELLPISEVENLPEQAKSSEQIPPVESVSVTNTKTETKTEDQQLIGIGKGWIVQLGSFESEQNAKKLNQTLLDKQFKSFIDPLKNSATNKTAYRVRVGPAQPDKAKAEALKKRLNDSVKIQGIIIEYP